MKLKSLALAVGMAAAGNAVYAEDLDLDVTLLSGSAGSWSAGLAATHLFAGAFTDTFTFSPNLSGQVSASLITTGFFDFTNIDFTGASINGQAFSNFSPNGMTEFGSFDLASLTGPLVLTVTGIAGPGLADGSAINASYGGNMNVSAVPEPGTAAMLFAGLAALGFVGKRRGQRS